MIKLQTFISLFYTSGVATANHAGAPVSIPKFSGVCVARTFLFSVVCYTSFFVLLVIALSALLKLMASDYPPLVSSSFSYYHVFQYFFDCSRTIICDILNHPVIGTE